MKKIFFLFSLLVLIDTSFAQAPRQLRKVTELKMPTGGGDNGGTVALSQKNRYYYATIAGNKTYSMAYFSTTGQMMSPPDLALLADIRGLWYNPFLKTFQANCAGTAGWVNYVLDDAGIPYDVKPLYPGQLQPFPQSVGSYNSKENVVYFLKGSTVVVYDAGSGKEQKEKTVLLKTGYSKKNLPPADFKMDSNLVLTQYNTTTVVFTAVPNAEFGLLNIKTHEIELYSRADGLLTQRLKLPPEAPVKEKLNFSFCNNIYWIYDKSNRSWIGYR